MREGGRKGESTYLTCASLALSLVTRILTMFTRKSRLTWQRKLYRVNTTQKKEKHTQIK